MKKLMVLVALILVVTLGGCNLGNTPTSKVEEMLGKYQRLDTDIKKEIDDIVGSENLTEEQGDRYRGVLEKQYQNMSYEIKDEEEDGNTATVTVTVTVMDYKKQLETLEANDNGTLEEYNDKKLDLLEKAKDKVTYTLELPVTKDEKGNWMLKALSTVDKKKLQGMY